MSPANGHAAEQACADGDERFLAEAGVVLAESLDYGRTLGNIADLAVRDLADFAVLCTFAEGGVLRHSRVAARDLPAQWIAARTTEGPIAKAARHPAWRVVESRRTFVDEMSPEAIDAVAFDEGLRSALRAANPTSVMGVPLLLGKECLGALLFVSCAAGRRFCRRQVELAEKFARRAALSIENARRHLAAQRAIHARDEVLGFVAHDLRNPLGNILMQTAFLRRGADERERRSLGAIALIERAAVRMSRLIEDLLDVTRLEGGGLSVAQVRLPAASVMTEVFESHSASAAAASVEFRLDTSPDLPDVLADRDRLLQVFENLVGNALKVTAPGGRIIVAAAPAGGEVVFRVVDTGAGIAPNQLPFVFDRFWQARRTGRKGVGLGLAIVKGIVEAHGGRVWVESRMGEGSSFFFALQAAPRRLAATGGVNARAPLASGRSKTRRNRPARAREPASVVPNSSAAFRGASTLPRHGVMDASILTGSRRSSAGRTRPLPSPSESPPSSSAPADKPSPNAAAAARSKAARARP